MNFNYAKIFLFLVFANLFNSINSIMFMNLLYGEKIKFFGIYNDIKKGSLFWEQYSLNKDYVLDNSCCCIIATSDYNLISEFINIMNNYKYEHNNSFKDLCFLNQYKEKFVKLDIRPVKKRVYFSDENEEFKKFLKGGFLCSERNENGELILTKFGSANCRNPDILHFNYLSKRVAENNICVLNHKIDLLIESLKEKDQDDSENLKKRKKLEEKLKAVNKCKKELEIIEKSLLQIQ